MPDIFSQSIITFILPVAGIKTAILESLSQTFMDTLKVVLSVVLFLTNLAVYLLQGASQVRLSEMISSGWESSIYYVNIAAVFFLLALALANALRLNLETYEIKKTLPSLVAGLLLANFSLYICKAVLDFTDIIVFELISGPTASGEGLGMQLMSFITGVDLANIDTTEAKAITAVVTNLLSAMAIGSMMGGIGAGTILGLIVALLILFVPTVVMLALAIVSLARIIILYILVVIAPLGVLAFFFPPTRTYGQKWMDGFIQWAFMSPIIFFLLRLVTFFQTSEESTTGAPDIVSGLETFARQWLFYLAGIAIMLAALIVPFQLGGLGSQIMKFWQGALTKHIPNALQLKERASSLAHAPIQPFKKLGWNKDFNALGQILGQRSYDKMLTSKRAETSLKSRQLQTTLNQNPTTKEDIKLRDSILRSLTKDSDEPFKGTKSSDLIKNIQKHPDFEKYRDKTLRDGDAFNELAGMNKELAQRAQNQFHPGHADATKFLENNWLLYNKDFLAGPKPKEFDSSDPDVNSHILSRYYTPESINDELTGTGRGLTLKSGIDSSKVEQNIQNDLKLHYKKEATGVPRNLTELKTHFKDDFTKQAKNNASNLIGVHNNKVGSLDLQNLSENLKNGNKSSMVSKLRNLGFDDSYIKKVEALETDESGTFLPSLNKLQMQNTFEKANNAKQKVIKEIIDNSASNPKLNINMSNVDSKISSTPKDEPEYIVYQNIKTKKADIETQGDFSTLKSSISKGKRADDLNAQMEYFILKSSNETKEKFFGKDSKLLETMKDSKKSMTDKMKEFNANTKKDDYLSDLVIFT